MHDATDRGMATRMVTLLFGSSSSVHAGPSASGVPAGPDQVAWGTDEVHPEPTPSRPPPPAIPAIVAGLVWTAAVWLGLAIFVVAIAYPFAILTRFALLAVASWLVAAGAAYGLATHRETHHAHA